MVSIFRNWGFLEVKRQWFWNSWVWYCLNQAPCLRKLIWSKQAILFLGWTHKVGIDIEDGVLWSFSECFEESRKSINSTILSLKIQMICQERILHYLQVCWTGRCSYLSPTDFCIYCAKFPWGPWYHPPLLIILDFPPVSASPRDLWRNSKFLPPALCWPHRQTPLCLVAPVDQMCRLCSQKRCSRQRFITWLLSLVHVCSMLPVLLQR